MDPARNPFAPGAGTEPPELAGRDDVSAAAAVALERTARGRPARSQLFLGLRGVGKTVLLNRVRELADEKAYECVVREARAIARIGAVPKSATSTLRTGWKWTFFRAIPRGEKS